MVASRQLPRQQFPTSQAGAESDYFFCRDEGRYIS